MWIGEHRNGYAVAPENLFTQQMNERARADGAMRIF